MCANDLQQAADSISRSDIPKIGDSLVNVLANVLSFGGASYEDGKIKGNKQNAYVRGIDETVGEISGRNRARQAQSEQRAAVDAEAVAKAKQLSDEQKRKELQDTQASNAAGAFRTSLQTQQLNSLGSYKDPSRDFLGL